MVGRRIEKYIMNVSFPLHENACGQCNRDIYSFRFALLMAQNASFGKKHIY